MGNASLLLGRVGSEDPARRMLKDLLRASETAAHLTHQLLAYSGKGRFVVEPLNLSTLVKEAGSLLQVLHTQECTTATQTRSRAAVHRSGCRPNAAAHYEPGHQWGRGY